MKLLLAAALYPPQEGGPATYAKLLVDELPKRGVSVTPVLFGGVLRYPPGVRHIVYVWRLVRQGRGCDIIFAQDPVSVGLPALIARFFLHKPLAVKVVGDHVWEQGMQRFGITQSLDEFPVFSWKWHPYLWFLRLLQRLVVRQADAVIVPSEYLKRIVTSWGCADVRVIYNGVHFAEVAEPVQDRPSGLLVVTAARLVSWKCIDAIIDVVAQESNWSLVVVGNGPERAALEARALHRGVAGRVRFVGTVPHAQALGWYAAADAFVLNSTYEGLSHTLLEVLYAKTPVVVTNIGGNPEVVTDGVNGLLIPPNDPPALHAALGRVLADSALAAKLGTAGRERAEAFSIQTTLDALVETLSLWMS